MISGRYGLFLFSKSLTPIVSRTTYCGPTEVKEPPKGLGCFSQIKALSETRFTPVSHVIMDLDGVFLDTVKFYYDAHTKYLAKFKKKFTPELKANAVGIHYMDAAKYIIAEHNLPMTPEVYVHGFWQYLRMYIQKAKLLDGSKNLICWLYENEVPLALVTSNTTKSFELKMENHQDMLKYFCHIVKGDDPEIKQGKPAADIYEIAARRFNIQPDNPTKFLVLEDSIQGIRAAKAAGMQSILIANKVIPRKLLKDAALIVNKITDIELKDFRLPTYPQGKSY